MGNIDQPAGGSHVVSDAERRTGALTMARFPAAQRVLALLSCSLLACAACGDELGTCDTAAAQELVYGQNGLVATKGQALMHDSCGSGAFCHAANAEGANRYGAPKGLSFDTLPLPTHWPEIVNHRGSIWRTVEDGTMPPEGEGQRARSTNDWAFDPARSTTARRLQPIRSRESKAALRNWLACGAPVVTATQIPDWARPASDAGDLTAWSDIFTQIMVPKCATAGCHNSPAAGGLVLLEECEAYAQLLAPSLCGDKPRLVPGDGESYLLNKLESKSPACGAPMPPAASLPTSELSAIRAWVEAMAPAPRCK